MNEAVLVAALPLTVLAALCFGATGSMQHQATQRLDEAPSGPRVLLLLVRQPLWVVAIVVNVVGIAAQFLALRFGPLLLVQPLLSTSLLFAVVTGALLVRRRPDTTVVVGAALTVVGLTGFLLVSRPSAGAVQATITPAATTLALALGALVLACLVAAHTVSGIPRSLLLALACGVLYGVTAGLIKAVVDQTAQGLLEPLQHWPLYAVAVVGPLGFLLNQGAFRAEPIVAPALAVITTVDPVVGIGIGLTWLGERIHADPASVALEVVSLLVLAGGITALALRAPHVGGGGGGGGGGPSSPAGGRSRDATRRRGRSGTGARTSR